jgi:hypothetical protein
MARGSPAPPKSLVDVKIGEMCPRCNLPLVELDAYGERLRGCLACNTWQVVATGEWRQLPEDDIAALRGIGTSQRWQVSK